MSYKVLSGFVLEAVLTIIPGCVSSTFLPQLFLSSVAFRVQPHEEDMQTIPFGFVHFCLCWLLTPVHQHIISHSEYVLQDSSKCVPVQASVINLPNRASRQAIEKLYETFNFKFIDCKMRRRRRCRWDHQVIQSNCSCKVMVPGGHTWCAETH